MSDSKQEDFSVAVVGAGIAGLALAIGLHKHNIPFTLYEEAPQYSTVGAGIGFGPNGLLAMDLIGEGFRPKYESICVGNKSARDQDVFFEGLLCEEGLGLDKDWYGRSSWGSPNYTRKSAHRKELLDILTSFIPIENVKFSKRLSNLEQHGDKAVLHFSDGEVVKASVVVGADGIQSVVRDHVLRPLSPDQVEPVYAQSYAYRAVIPMEAANEILGDLTDTAKIYVGQDRNVVTYRITGGKEFNFLHCVYTDAAWPTPDSMTQEVTHEEMMADFEGHGIDERLLRLLGKAKPIRWGLFHHLRSSTYFRGRAVLMGDSAHASLPYQAAGAGQGVEDALILSTVLGHVSKVSSKENLTAALEAYDAVRRPRAQRQLEQSLEAGELLSSQDPKAGSDMEQVLQRMQGDRFDWLWFHDLRQDVQLAREEMEQRLSTSVNGSE
ncbi:hypothetical protein M409DRAFT_23052 [Zasmidium cellare ATCC 36951]|uniref:FAD-binding domain-containing protein n=1 Tax=Zasmidium cellare ATCC 36951 TaxID=1080233 RepID=A0A6A6CKD1_ZASCE|nr:uncharacterized protein M409DRAFT_23052 [Zasmidium cellare ATCC 36951]KAF2166412.1 hypothetical protein M409DRAFT_23052 [Zasmidium cellare ATCC 36951]